MQVLLYQTEYTGHAQILITFLIKAWINKNNTHTHQHTRDYSCKNLHYIVDQRKR